jgi:hypothetical protein
MPTLTMEFLGDRRADAAEGAENENVSGHGNLLK